MAMQPRDAIVIGAGHNGLTAACYLAKAGLDVLVVEAADSVGGMTATRALIPEAPDHQINLCAIDVTLTHLLRIVASELNLTRFGYREIQLDPGYACVDPDGGSFAIWQDPLRTADEIRRFSRHDADAYLELIRLAQAGLDIAGPFLVTNPTRPAPRSVFAALRGAARNRKDLSSLLAFSTATALEAIDERFEHPLVRGFLGVMGSSTGPLTASGSGAALGYWGLVHRYGVGRVLGGTQGLPDALQRCLTAAGGTVRTSAVVDQLIVEGETVTGIRLSTGEELRSRAVIAACDPHQTLTKLLPPGVLSERHAARAAHIPTTNGGAMCLKVDVALSGRVEMQRHHQWRSDSLDLRTPLLLQGTLEQQMAAQQDVASGLLPQAIPHMVCIPTAVDPAQAPDGQDTVYIYAFPVPHQPSEPWGSLAQRAADSLVKEAGTYYDGIESLELGRFVEPWPLLAERTRSTNGHFGHVDVNLFRAGPLRPALGFGGHSTPVDGLFLSGAGTHPGPGMSGMPGRLSARRVLQSFRTARPLRS